MQPNSKKYFTQWMHDVWRNKFLFWAVIAGFVTIFPTIYIPVLNHEVFKQAPIDWEWGVVFVEAAVFFMGCELWKWGKRVFFRRRAKKMGYTPEDLERMAFADFLQGEQQSDSREDSESKV